MSTDDETGRSRIKISILIVSGLLLAPLLTIALFLVLMNRQNEIANDERTNQGSALLSYFAETMRINTTENSSWGQNYEEVVRRGNFDWWQDNLGYTQYGNMGHEASVVVGPDGGVHAGGWLGEKSAWDPAAVFGPVYRDLLARLVADPDAEAVGSFVGGPDGIGYFAIAEITPEGGARVETRRFNVFYFQMDAEQMELLRETSSWDDLDIGAEASGKSNLPITDASGHTVGYLVWDHPNPAFRALWEMLPLLAAKDRKPGAVRLYHDDFDRDLRIQLDLERQMRAGLPRGEFFVVYQPIYSIADNRIGGVEALVRWNHPTRGLISPLEFIPAAESSRFVIELGAFVIAEACSAFAQTSRLRVSVNLSPVQMLDDQLVAKVSAILTATGIDPERLELEITEGYLVDQEDRAADVVRRLRALGLRISLDDFGTGYASVGYLRKFALDKVKIDRSFVRPIIEDEQARDVLRAIIAPCRAFRVTITAEGVETSQQADLLRDMGCDLLQGYLIRQPVSAAEILSDLDSFMLDPSERRGSATASAPGAA